ncbi:lipid droplet-associated protein [Nocardia cyriacigeorgica]|uniref:lipid droplet-associated protein n=1 Tax=Nocardia cyriacigeorgica TaxID=135487 RepID=UPI0024546D21|nr:lipid droplet-associated protein [Nocardia cyriacigeorgica]
MFRPPFLARVAAGAAVYAIEETRRLPTAAVNFPITAISQLLQTTMHVQQFVTSLALKGDAVFDRISPRAVDQPAWATFDEDDEPAQPFGAAFGQTRTSSFDSFGGEAELAEFFLAETLTGARTGRNGHAATVRGLHETADTPDDAEAEREADAPTEAEPEAAAADVAEPAAEEIAEPEVATRYDYASMTLAQLRARLRMLTIDDLTALLDYEQRTRARAPFITMLTNRIATVRAQ